MDKSHIKTLFDTYDNYLVVEGYCLLIDKNKLFDSRGFTNNFGTMDDTFIAYSMVVERLAETEKKCVELFDLRSKSEKPSDQAKSDFLDLGWEIGTRAEYFINQNDFYIYSKLLIDKLSMHLHNALPKHDCVCKKGVQDYYSLLACLKNIEPIDVLSDQIIKDTKRDLKNTKYIYAILRYARNCIAVHPMNLGSLEFEYIDGFGIRPKFVDFSSEDQYQTNIDNQCEILSLVAKYGERLPDIDKDTPVDLMLDIIIFEGLIDEKLLLTTKEKERIEALIRKTGRVSATNDIIINGVIRTIGDFNSATVRLLKQYPIRTYDHGVPDE